MSNVYEILYTIALVIIGLLVIACLIRAIRGPRIADRVIAANMIGTLVVITIFILSFVSITIFYCLHLNFGIRYFLP